MGVVVDVRAKAVVGVGAQVGVVDEATAARGQHPCKLVKVRPDDLIVERWGVLDVQRGQ